jgi:hypothetical protein
VVWILGVRPVSVTAGNSELMRKLGVMEDATIGGEASVKLKHIDPVYTITNEPELFRDPEFRRLKAAYASELKIVSDITAQHDEHTREWRTHKRETKFR